MAPLIFLIAIQQAPTQSTLPEPLVTTAQTVAQQLRVYNATTNGMNLDLLIDTGSIAKSVAPLTATGNIDLQANQVNTLEVRTAGGSTDLAIYTIPQDGNEHVLAVSGDSPDKLSVEDLAVTPIAATNSTKAQVNVLNAAPDDIDIYLVDPSWKITTVEPQSPALSPGGTGVVTQDPGTYKAVLTPVGMKVIRIDSNNYEVQAGQRIAVIAIGGGKDQPDRLVTMPL